MFPFVFDVPDRDLHGEFVLPAHRKVQLTAFAHELDIYENEEEFARKQEEEAPGQIKFAPESFMPIGLFGDEGAEPRAEALFTGKVLRGGWIRNDASGQFFYWMLVQTLGCEIDVVADRRLIGEQEVREGSIVSGTFWLSGRLLADE